MTALLPLRRRSMDRCIVTAEADRLVKKDGRLFGLDRQLGLDFEACYSFYLENGRLERNSVRQLQPCVMGGSAWLEVDERRRGASLPKQSSSTIGQG